MYVYIVYTSRIVNMCCLMHAFPCLPTLHFQFTLLSSKLFSSCRCAVGLWGYECVRQLSNNAIIKQQSAVYSDKTGSCSAFVLCAFFRFQFVGVWELTQIVEGIYIYLYITYEACCMYTSMMYVLRVLHMLDGIKFLWFCKYFFTTCSLIKKIVLL